MMFIRGYFWRYFLLSLFCAILGAGAVLFYPFKVSSENTTIEVAYMRYACGECYVQYRILKAARQGEELVEKRTSDNENTSPVRFIGWDVLVFYKGDDEALSEYIDKHYDRSENCMQLVFRVQGQFKRKLIYSIFYRGDQYDGIYFDAQSATAIGHPSPTCKQPKEVVL
jgi:hypothetical protein